MKEFNKFFWGVALLVALIPFTLAAGEVQWNIGGGLDFELKECPKKCKKYAEAARDLAQDFRVAMDNKNFDLAEDLQADINYQVKKLNKCLKGKKKKGFFKKLLNGLAVVGVVITVVVTF